LIGALGECSLISERIMDIGSIVNEIAGEDKNK